MMSKNDHFDQKHPPKWSHSPDPPRETVKNVNSFWGKDVVFSVHGGVGGPVLPLGGRKVPPGVKNDENDPIYCFFKLSGHFTAKSEANS